MTAAQTRIAETIDAFYGEAGTKDNVSAYYRQAVEDLDAETVKELVHLSLFQFSRRTAPIEHVSSTQFPASAPTSLISMKQSKNAPINSWITMPSEQKSNASSTNPATIRPSFPKQRKKQPWPKKSTRI